MAFNPDPKVREAADLAKKYNKTHVIVFMFDETTQTVEYASYGKDTKRCAQAKTWAEHLFEITMNRLAWVFSSNEGDGE